jgi:hypothetical protein
MIISEKRDGTVDVTMSSIIDRFDSLSLSTMNFPISYKDFMSKYEAWQNGVLIQHAFPELSANEREFIMTGITPDQWEGLWKEEE